VQDVRRSVHLPVPRARFEWANAMTVPGRRYPTDGAHPERCSADEQIIEEMERSLAGMVSASRDGEGMTSPLDSLVTITFVADANTPPEYASSAGRVIALTAPVQVGSGGHLQGIPGLVRQGTAGLEFLMMAGVPVVADAAPIWGQALRTDLTASLTVITQRVNAIRADVTAIKLKLGA
jgi:hypothetical protein